MPERSQRRRQTPCDVALPSHGIVQPWIEGRNRERGRFRERCDGQRHFPLPDHLIVGNDDVDFVVPESMDNASSSLENSPSVRSDGGNPHRQHGPAASPVTLKRMASALHPSVSQGPRQPNDEAEPRPPGPRPCNSPKHASRARHARSITRPGPAVRAPVRCPPIPGANPGLRHRIVPGTLRRSLAKCGRAGV